MKIMHENGKLFGKISIIDIIIVIVAIILLYGVFGKYINKVMPSTASQVKYQNFKFAIRIENTLQETADAIRKDDIVLDTISGVEIGKVSEIMIEPYKEAFDGLNGEIVMKEMPDKVNIILTVETSGTINNNEYLANGLIKILVGETKKIRTKYIDKTGFVISIEKVEE